jgi:hypothetical protein
MCKCGCSPLSLPQRVVVDDRLRRRGIVGTNNQRRALLAVEGE